MSISDNVAMEEEGVIMMGDGVEEIGPLKNNDALFMLEMLWADEKNSLRDSVGEMLDDNSKEGDDDEEEGEKLKEGDKRDGKEVDGAAEGNVAARKLLEEEALCREPLGIAVDVVVVVVVSRIAREEVGWFHKDMKDYHLLKSNLNLYYFRYSND